MIEQYNKRSLAFGIPGLILQLGSQFLASLFQTNGGQTERAVGAVIAVPFLLLGTVLLIIGLCYYAKAKGYSGVLGLLGLLSCLGLIILACLKDKTLPPPGPARTLIVCRWWNLGVGETVF